MAAIFIPGLEGPSLTFSLFNTPFLPLSRRTSSTPLLRNGISSSKLPIFNLHLRSSTPNALGSFGLVSTTECSDGSLVFHFGNVSEKERNAQVEESGVILGATEDSKVKVGGALVKPDTEDVNAVAVSDADNELEIVGEKTDSQRKREKRNRPDQVVDTVNLRTAEKEDIIAFDCQADVVKTNQHSNNSSIENDGRQIFSPVSISECNDSVTVESGGALVSKVSSEQSSKAKDAAILSDDVVIIENSTAYVSVLGSGQSSRTENINVLSDDGETVENSKVSFSVVSSEQNSRTKDITLLSGDGETEENDTASASASDVIFEQSSRNNDEAVLSDDGGRIENCKASVSEVSTEQSTKTEHVTASSYEGVTGENSKSSISEMTSERSIGTEDVSGSSIPSILNSMSDDKKVSSSLEDPQKPIENKTVTLSSSSELGDRAEVTNNYVFREGIEAIADSEVMHLPITVEAHNLKVHEDSYENNMMEELPTLAPTEAELTMEGATNNTVDESIAIDPTGSIEMSQVSVPRSTLREIDSQIEIGDTDPWSASSELQLIGTVSMREDISAKVFFLSSGAALLPGPFKVLAGGEDAYFVICENWLGVADGASSWSLEGTRDGLYAHELLKNCERIILEGKSLPVTNPAEVLFRSAAKSQSPGLSTMLVAYFDNQVLRVANIGDSGFILLRDGTVFQRSSPMFYDFNLPVQIKRDDDPSELLEVYHVHLDEGDVLITATDGLFDNLYEQEIASIVSKSLQENIQPQEIAELLARKAQIVGSSASARSPFADAAHAAGYTGYRGGKLDDVTVIVSLVQKKSV